MPKITTQDAIKILRTGGVGVMPTDTILGIVGQAINKKTVERIYKARRRSPDKPFIILIASIDDIKKFNIIIDRTTKKILQSVWPGPVSVVLSCPQKNWDYLHRGQKTLAFRLPNNNSLIKLLKQTGPLIVPSANLEGQPPASSIAQAQAYFKDQIDFYLSPASRRKKSSTLVALVEKKFRILRKGAGHIPQHLIK